MYLIGNLTCHLTAIACVSSNEHPKPPPIKVINSFLNLVHSIAYKINTYIMQYVYNQNVAI